jgi:serine/threonine protein kinase
MSIKYNYLASGGFGFVISPNIVRKSTNISDYNFKTVSKIFMKRDDALTEFDNHTIVNTLDPDYEFHLKLLKMNKITAEELRHIDIKNIPSNIKKLLTKDIYYYINYDFGGITLMELFGNKTLPFEKPIYVRICEEFLKTIKVVKILLANNYIHHDLKLNNILVDNNLVFKIIDFGLMEHIPDYYDYCVCVKNDNPMPIFEYFPLEIEYYNVKNYENCEDIAKQRNYSSIMVDLKIKYSFFHKKYSLVTSKQKYEDMITLMKTEKTHAQFLNASFNTFDIYTLGLALLFISEQYVNIKIKKSNRAFDDFCDSTEYSYHYSEWIHFDTLYDLIVKMITPNVFERITIDDLIVEFEKYLRIIYNDNSDK